MLWQGVSEPRSKNPNKQQTDETKIRTTCGAAIQILHLLVIVRAGTLRRQLFLAKLAAAAGDLERGDDPVAFLELLHAIAHRMHPSAELVAENIAAFELGHRS